MLLGSQTLVELKDRIYCMGNFSDTASHIPSSCFIIENKFYNDTRDLQSELYSDTIINWVKQGNRYEQPGLQHYDADSMEKVTFNELSIRIGSQYLFWHQGDCKHVMIFTKMRMYTPHDHPNMVAYPLRPFQARTRRKKCRVCNLYPACYTTYSDKLSSENPFYWCEECYIPLHYSIDGKLLYNDFKVFPFKQDY